MQLSVCSYLGAYSLLLVYQKKRRKKKKKMEQQQKKFFFGRNSSCTHPFLLLWLDSAFLCFSVLCIEVIFVLCSYTIFFYFIFCSVAAAAVVVGCCRRRKLKTTIRARRSSFRAGAGTFFSTFGAHLSKKNF